MCAGIPTVIKTLEIFSSMLLPLDGVSMAEVCVLAAGASFSKMRETKFAILTGLRI